MAKTKTATLLIRTDIDFDNDEATPHYVGVFFSAKSVKEAKVKDMVKTLKEDTDITKEETKDVIAACTGKNKYGYTTAIDKFFVSEDEIEDNDETHISPAHSWKTEKVKVEIPA